MATNRRNGGKDSSGGESAPEKKRKRVVPETPPEIVSVTGDPFPAAPPKPEPGEMWVTLLESSPWSTGPSTTGERGSPLPSRSVGAAQGPELAARWSEPIWRAPDRGESEESDSAATAADDGAEFGAQPAAEALPSPEGASQPEGPPKEAHVGATSLAELVQLTEFSSYPVARGEGSSMAADEVGPPDIGTEPVIEPPEVELPGPMDAFEGMPPAAGAAEEAVPAEPEEAVVPIPETDDAATVVAPAELGEPVVPIAETVDAAIEAAHAVPDETVDPIPATDDAAAEPMVEESETAETIVGLPELEVGVVVETFEAMPEVELPAEDAALAEPAEWDRARSELTDQAAIIAMVIDEPEAETVSALPDIAELTDEGADATGRGDPVEPADPAVAASDGGPETGTAEPTTGARQGAAVREVPVEDLLGGVLDLAGSAVRGIAATAAGLVDGLAKGGRMLGSGLLSGARRVSGTNENCGSCVPPRCDSKAKK